MHILHVPGQREGARDIHRGIIKVPTVSTLCYTHLQVAWQTEGRDTAPPNRHALQEL